MSETLKWKEQDKTYHEDSVIVDSFDQRISQKYRVEHKYFTLDKWIEELKANQASYVLDFGCATGTASLALLRNGLKAVSVDFSMSMIQKVKEKSKAESLNVRGLIADVEELPFKDEVFDGVICMGVLHHLPNILKGVEEQIRVLKKGGVIFISEPFYHKAWISYPYDIGLNVIKFILNVFKRNRLTTLERLLTFSHIEEIKDILNKYDLEYQIKYFVYWPNIVAYLPEAVAVYFVKLINRLNFYSNRGDIVFITIRKRHA